LVVRGFAGARAPIVGFELLEVCPIGLPWANLFARAIAKTANVPRA
jgi:hypothetical protein